MPSRTNRRTPLVESGLKKSESSALNELRARTARLVLDGQPSEAMFAWMRFLQEVSPRLSQADRIRAQRLFEEFVDEIDPGDDAPTTLDQ